jgi:hypothetical protein
MAAICSNPSFFAWEAKKEYLFLAWIPGEGKQNVLLGLCAL